MTQRERHMRALNAFAEQVKGDPNVVALLLSGSLSYGAVWEKSDIDLTLIARDGAAGQDFCVEEDGIEIHMSVTSVSDFRSSMQKFRAGQFVHSFLSKGTLIFTKDESLAEMFERSRRVGMDDAAVACLASLEGLLIEKYRAEKWVTVFSDPLYSQRFLHACAVIVADMLLLINGEEPTRESLLRASELEPELMRKLYVTPLTTAMTEADVREALAAIDGFIMKHMDFWSGPVLDFLSDGETRKISEINKRFGAGVEFPLAYLAEKGVLERLTVPSRVFKHSMLKVDEVAYVYLKN